MYKKFTTLFLLILLTGTFCFAQQGHSFPPGSGGESIETKVVKVYPNPASTQINFEIQGNNEGVYEVIVYNFLGKRIDDIKNISNRSTVSLDKYYNGIYIYQLRDSKGNLVETGKFNVIKAQ